MARFHRSRGREILAVIGVLLLALLRWLGGDTLEAPPKPSVGGLRAGTYSIQRVVDGDTLLVEGGRLRIRLQGVDTPETVKEGTPVEPWGRWRAAR